MGIDFKLTKEEAEGRTDVVVFRLAGWLDAQSEAQLVQAVQQAIDGGAKYVVLNLRKVHTITSAGIRAIQQACQIVTPREETSRTVRLKLCNAPPQIYQVLSITGVLISIPMYESVDIAVDSFGK